MTDNEIIKMLEDNALKCTHYGDIGNGGLFESALDLLSRQKAEIEELKIELKAMRGTANTYKKWYHEAKSEAIKEFAERLKALKIESDCIQFGHFVTTRTIDNLVKEMTEVKS